MRRVALRFPIQTGTPIAGANGRLTALGVLFRERIGSLTIDWPAVGIQQIEVSESEVTVLLTAAPKVRLGRVRKAIHSAVRITMRVGSA